MCEHNEIDDEIRESPAEWTLSAAPLHGEICCAADAVRREGNCSPNGARPFPARRHQRRWRCRSCRSSNPAPHAAKEYTLTGPVAHSYDEVASVLAAVAGHAVAYQPLRRKFPRPVCSAADTPSCAHLTWPISPPAYNAADHVVSRDLPMLPAERRGHSSSFLKITTTPFLSGHQGCATRADPGGGTGVNWGP